MSIRVVCSDSLLPLVSNVLLTSSLSLTNVYINIPLNFTYPCKLPNKLCQRTEYTKRLDKYLHLVTHKMD